MSKGLEALNSLFETMPFAFLESNTMKELRIIEKELKALEIIKNNIFEFIFIDITKRVVLCFGETSWSYYCKTQEEYNLLKEVLS